MKVLLFSVKAVWAAGGMKDVVELVASDGCLGVRVFSVET